MDMTAGGAKAASDTEGSGDPGSDSWPNEEDVRIPIDVVTTAVSKGTNADPTWRLSVSMERGDSTLPPAIEATFMGKENNVGHP